MRERETPVPGSVVHIINCLGIGGTERQLGLLLDCSVRDRRSPVEALPGIYTFHAQGELQAPLRALGLSPLEFQLPPSLLHPGLAPVVARVARRLRSDGARVVHCHDYYSNLVGGLAAWVAGRPWICSRRDLGAWRTATQNRVLAVATRRAPAVIANCWAIRDHLVYSEGVVPSRVHVIPNGIDLAEFDRQAGQTAAPDLPAADLVYVANMKHAAKGHADLIVAFAALRRSVPGVRLLLVGDGAERPRYERLAQQLGVAQGITFAGRRTDIPALLQRCRIAVSPSRSEGLSNAVMEAMAARLPVVATRVGGTGELVRDARTGFLVPPGDPAALVRRLLDLWHHAGLSKRMGAAGRARLEAEFDVRALRQRVSGLYGDLLGRSVRPRPTGSTGASRAA